jgi:hypothetical protein
VTISTKSSAARSILDLQWLPDSRKDVDVVSSTGRKQGAHGGGDV